MISLFSNLQAPSGKTFGLQGFKVKLGFNVDKCTAFDQFTQVVGEGPLQEFLVGNRSDNSVGLGQVIPSGEANAIFMLSFGGIAYRFVDDDVNTIGFEFVDDVNDFGISKVWAIFFESEA